MADSGAKSVWILGIIVRCILIWFPLRGYIHPDEYFQSTEITAGDILSQGSFRSWEYNASYPVRSVVSPYSTSALPYYALKMFNELGLAQISAQNLIIYPRFYMTAIMFMVDFVVFRVLSKRGKDPWPNLAVLSTSYVHLVFNSKTFTNSVECLLFSLVILLSSETSSGVRNCLYKSLTGVIVAFGFFCRPTFLAYAMIPCMMVLYQHMSALKEMVKDVLAIGVAATVTVILIVRMDMKYYQSKSLILTPWNFLQYNMLHAEKHGVHPRFTHSLVNLPLLFGPLTIVLFLFLALLVYSRNFTFCFQLLEQRSTNSESTSGTPLNKFLITCIIIPVCLLSVVAHQEPRFIVPVLVPMVLLFGHLVYGQCSLQLITMSWTIWNVLGFVLFGVFHQGGVVPCLTHLQKHLRTEVEAASSSGTYHVVFFHSYMPPRAFLSWPLTDSPNYKMFSEHKLSIHDLAGSPCGVLQAQIREILLQERGKQFQVFVASPSTIDCHLHSFELVQQFTPHLSLEDPPRLDTLALGPSRSAGGLVTNLQQWISPEAWTSYLQEIKHQFSFNLYQFVKQEQD